MTGLITDRPALRESQFRHISELVKRICGINLHTGKRELVHARLNKRLRQLGLSGFGEYIERLDGPEGEAEVVTMLDLLSTNVTQFLREPAHFEFLRDSILPALARQAPPRRVRIWSAGCSTGEEPYSIAMVLLDALSDLAGWDIRVLATDLSTRALEAARAATYPAARLKDLPPMWKSSYFTPVQGRAERLFEVADCVRRMVRFARLNLMGHWPMRGPFDVIFCRNVMIYFDKPVQLELVRRFRGLLAPGGHLLLGHSESLAGVRHDFRYVQPTIYRRA